MRLAALSVGMLLLIAGAAQAAEVVVERVKDDPFAAEPFEFTFQKADFKYDNYAIWGKVTNPKDARLISNLTIVLTVYDADNKFLGRGTSDVGPRREGGSPVGYVDGAQVDIGRGVPARIEWQLIPQSPQYLNLRFQPSVEQTASDVPLVFELQRISTGYGGLQIWGRVTNAGKKTYEGAQVILTAYDANDEFVGRGRDSASPHKIGPGNVTYIDGLSLNIDDRAPVRVEWKVIVEEY